MYALKACIQRTLNVAYIHILGISQKSTMAIFYVQPEFLNLGTLSCRIRIEGSGSRHFLCNLEGLHGEHLQMKTGQGEEKGSLHPSHGEGQGWQWLPWVECSDGTLGEHSGFLMNMEKSLGVMWEIGWLRMLLILMATSKFAWKVVAGSYRPDGSSR